MLIGVPLDYRNTRRLSEMIGTFGQFLDWAHTDRRLVRSLVRASFPENALVPRDIVFREFSPWGAQLCPGQRRFTYSLLDLLTLPSRWMKTSCPSMAIPIPCQEI